MKILVVHEVSYKEKPVYEYQDFPERLSFLGNDVTVVDFDKDGPGNRLDITYSRTGLANIRLRRPSYWNIPILKFFFAQFSYYRFIHHLLKNDNFDAILVYSVFINGWMTVKIANQTNTPLVYRVLDAYHLLHSNKIAQKLLLLGEKYIYRNAQKLLVTNAEMVSYIKKLATNLNKDPVILDHGVDTQVFFPHAPDPLILKKYNIEENDRVIVFLGTTYNFSGLDEILERMPRLLKKQPNIRLLIIGGGELDSKLQDLVNTHNLENRVILTGMIDYKYVPQFLSVADLAINPFKINPITKNIIPIKVLQYLSCAKPMLCTPLNDVMNKFPPRISGAIYTNTDDSDEFCRIMLELIEDPTLLGQLSSTARKFILENSSIELTIKKLINEFKYTD